MPFLRLTSPTCTILPPTLCTLLCTLLCMQPEYARHTPAGDDDEDDDEDEAGSEEDEEDDGQWNGRLGEIKRHIMTMGRATVDTLRKEVGKVLSTINAGSDKAAAAAAAAATTAVAAAAMAPESAAGGTPAGAEGNLGSAVAVDGGSGRPEAASAGHLLPAAHAANTPPLDERTAQLVASHVGAMLSREIGALRQELLAEVARTAGLAHTLPGGRLPPLPADAVGAPQAAVSRSASMHLAGEAPSRKKPNE
jgi:hypothetical protein